ncbi:hypothetical protein M4D81_03655 [Paenibacillus sp. p3-SID867]|uniref:hypothetical protein n=1 Tax=Paenibacillus sp. p3-SID867 TaxID=2916363 RepID=UPI0021A924B0|nr:hypothetical protein [Paenibacillus sp. p3-SID867]MCT1398095.1 hypothetical protein [Paenibacillus sp. p3-SID867]
METTMQKSNGQDLFIDVLADMICQYLDAKQERQQRADYWLNLFENVGIEAQIVA